MSEKKRTVLRTITEVIFLILAIVLLKNHKLQMWLAVFGLGVIGSLFFGRFYCSWICPMNTFFRVINFIYGKLGIKRLKTPNNLQNNVLRILFLIAFIGVMAAARILHLKINVLLFITAISVFITLIFEEAFWHRRLCPFGTVLSLSSRKARYSMHIDEEKCISCGRCQKVCPAGSILTMEDGKRRNKINECLLCGKCTSVCPTEVCKFELKQLFK